MICFVILHYGAIDMTIDCIWSIQEHLEGEAYQIIIVDNHSPDGSGSRLSEQYWNNPQVHVILLERNEGFAKGNNEGFRYAKQLFRPEYIVVMNNDTLLRQHDFTEVLRRIYEETQFDILGPDIVSGIDGTHQNPAHELPMTAKQVRQLIKEKIIYLQARRDRNIGAILRLYLMTIKNTCFSKMYKQKKEYQRRKTGCILHGACLIFSKQLAERWDMPFDSGTFLYMEEEILHFHGQACGAVMVYDPAISILHMEDVSTDTVCKSKREKNIFKAEQMIRSATYFLKLMTEK